MRAILDSWFFLQNEWDEELFLSIPIDHRKSVPRTPDGFTFYKSCCMDTFKYLIKREYDDKILKEVLEECIGSSNIKKIKILLNNIYLSDDTIVTTLSQHQNLYLFLSYKDMLQESETRPEVWKKILLSGVSLREMCMFSEYLLRLLSRCHDGKALSMLCLIAPPNREVLSILAHRTPPSWAHRVAITIDTFIVCIHYNVDVTVLDALTQRELPITGEHLREFMNSYQPSLVRERVFYRCLHMLRISEYDFLEKYMKDHRRFRNARKLRNREYEIATGDYSNTHTLYGIDVDEVPTIFSIPTIHKGGISYLLDVREVHTLVNGDTYVHPYTRQVMSSERIRSRYQELIEFDIPTCIDVTDVPESHFSNEQRITEMVEKNDLSLYMNDMVTISCTYGIDTLLALSSHPDIVRMYDGDLVSTIISLCPSISMMAKECI